MLDGTWTSSSGSPGCCRAHANLPLAIDPMSAQKTWSESGQSVIRRRYTTTMRRLQDAPTSSPAPQSYVFDTSELPPRPGGDQAWVAASRRVECYGAQTHSGCSPVV